MKRYHTVIARESITYSGLIKYDVNCELAPCPAFSMQPKECVLPNFFENDIVGINFGPLAQGNEAYNALYYENMIECIKTILLETDYHIALINHMNWRLGFSDYEVHDELFREFEKSGRFHNLPEINAPTIKYMIGKMRLLITTRTHVAIAGYSMCVPTLVTGYKMKSIAIAKDIFGEQDNHVLSIQDLESKNDFAIAFKKLLDNQENIRGFLKKRMPEYIRDTNKIKEIVDRIRLS